MTTPSGHADLDKKTIAINKHGVYFNLGALLVIVVICGGAVRYFNSIEHAVLNVEAGMDRLNATLKEVKTQLIRQDGKTNGHATRLDRVEFSVDALTKRVLRLEKGK